MSSPVLVLTYYKNYVKFTKDKCMDREVPAAKPFRECPGGVRVHGLSG